MRPSRDLTLDNEIDQLYQLPLSEFTSARDELAKRLATDGPAIRRLQKPSVAAWAVNQLYWRERGKYEALVAAASKVRAAHLATLKGKPADLGGLESKQASARRAAFDLIRKILSDAGETLSLATTNAINETLDALPSEAHAGRLVRPLKPAGFEGLAGMLKGGTVKLRTAQVLPFRKKKTAATQSKDLADARKDLEKLKAALQKARGAQRLAISACRRAQQALRTAKLVRERAMTALDDATDQLGNATRDLEARERVAVAATAARDALETQLALKKG
jgi:hypothetical protein